MTIIDGRGGAKISETVTFEKEEYLSLTDLSASWNAQAAWSELTGNADLKLPGHTLRFSADNTFFLVDGKSYNLFNPVRLYQGELYVPMELFTRFLITLWGRSIIWDSQDRKLSLGGISPEQIKIPEARRRPGVQEKTGIQKVVLDPGHGGKDPGAVGPTGLCEKDVTLEIAFMLKTILEQDYNLIVVMTRRDDTFIPLGDRTKIANQEAADIFISIHCNAAPRKKAKLKTMRGVETYFLSLAKTDDARATAAMENSAISFEQPQQNVANQDDVQFILWDMVQNEFLTESSDLAELVQESLARKLPTVPSRGINQAGFYVLNGAYMPAILVETSFISHKEEEKLLKKPDNLKKIAQGIASGLAAFAQKYQKEMGQ
ncbi:N-acetylmuramoyl-L-alanine amidase [candidate division TA06 bacterium]|uniref:N-acetylmuramoyl-L-alanine amidase n=1 Tax=candidate division TA06 bacterium TaxID=2250710 RepID=A0A933I8W2_UNCT6|nr:N-acetylmuramoyl-L-alanine amidase [candidate division TA06 bacterium]